jgi:hypothetical protein
MNMITPVSMNMIKRENTRAKTARVNKTFTREAIN